MATTADRFKTVFEPELIKEIEQRGKHMAFKSGDVILDIGQQVKIMPIILSGSVKISRVDEEGRELLGGISVVPGLQGLAGFDHHRQGPRSRRVHHDCERQDGDHDCGRRCRPQPICCQHGPAGG